jgi:hypothetical protein
MRSIIRKVVVVAAIALSANGLTSAAHAETELPVYSDTVVLSGCVNIAAPGVQLVGGSGTFTGPATCAAPYNVLPTVCEIHSNPAVEELPAELLPEPCTFNFNGSYGNTVCGTGNATGTADITSAHDVYHASFTVIFVAGQGVLTGFAPDDDGGDTFAGPVDIIPTSPFPPSCPVSQFRFTAALVGLDI